MEPPKVRWPEHALATAHLSRQLEEMQLTCHTRHIYNVQDLLLA